MTEAFGRVPSRRVGGGREPRPLLLAHRGDHRHAPENSLEALRSALDVPVVDGVEIDVRSSADRVAIVLHDTTLARVQARPEAARSLSAAELALLGVPSLDAALAVVPPPAFLDVELKEDVAEQVVAAVGAARGDPPARVVLSSFETGVLERLGSLAPAWSRWLNVHRLDEAAIDRARRLGCAGVSAGWRSVDEASVSAARSAGLEVAAWTVTSRVEVDRLTGCGVVAICVEGEALDRG